MNKSKASPALSIIILTSNEAKNLPACLASLQGLGGEIFVVDSGSTDGTQAVAANCGAIVVDHPFENYSAQRNWAQHHLPLNCEWLLHLDADERLTAELRDEIGALLDPSKQREVEIYDGFLLRKRTIFMNRWIRYGGHYPSYHLRLFRRSKGVCEERLYDQHFVVQGETGTLKHDYLDVVCSDLDTWLQRHIRWAALEARQLLAAQKPSGGVRARLFGNPIERKRWLRERIFDRTPLFVRPVLYWIYRYFLRLGFLDGKAGFTFHLLQGLWFRLLVDMKLDEMRRPGSRSRANAMARRFTMAVAARADHFSEQLCDGSK